jgi:hypothetical protein
MRVFLHILQNIASVVLLNCFAYYYYYSCRFYLSNIHVTQMHLTLINYVFYRVTYVN